MSKEFTARKQRVRHFATVSGDPALGPKENIPPTVGPWEKVPMATGPATAMLPGPEPCRFCHFAMVSGGAKNLKIEGRDSKSSDLGKLVFPLSTPIDEDLVLARANQLGAMERVVIQPMIAGGVEVMAGMTQDPLFGPLIAFGLGG